MTQVPYQLAARPRTVVLNSIQQTCAHYGWTLCAVHIRSTHVHVVVEVDAMPERVLNAMKSYASRRLNEEGVDPVNCKRWSRHGSTRYLWKREHVKDAIADVMDQQG